MSRDAGGAGLPGSLRRFGAALIGAVESRLGLLATELEESGVRALRLLVLGMTTLFFLGLGIVLGTLFLVLLFWDSHRLAVVGILTGLFASIGLLTGLAFRATAQSGPELFAATLEELSRDREILADQDPPHS